MNRSYLLHGLMRRSAIVFNRLSHLVARVLARELFSVLVDGEFLYAPTTVRGGLYRSLIKGVYEQDERIIVGRFLTANDTVIEFGGAIGVLASAYARISSRRHLALEPNPSIAEVLRKNLARARIVNVSVVEAAASWEDGTCQFFIDDDFYSSSMINRQGEEITVPCVNVNRLIIEHEINTIISDIEGFEFSLFKNIDLTPIKKIVVEIHDVDNSARNVSELLALLFEAGFGFEVRNWRGNVLVFRK